MSKFVADNGKYFTKQLFYEQWVELPIDRRTRDDPPFTLYKDKPGFVNFGKKYVEYGDPTGYAVTRALLNGEYNHWVALNACTWFQAARSIWDEELDAKLKNDAFAKIKELLHDGLPAQQLAAAKYLANAEHRKARTGGKGRPSKEEVHKETLRAVSVERELADDFRRIKAVS